MRIRVISLALFLGVVLSSSSLLLRTSARTNPAAEKSPVLRALEEELQRDKQILTQKGDPAPYFMGYKVNDVKTSIAVASYGAIRSSGDSHSRTMDIDVRVGDYQLDSTHRMRGGGRNGAFSAPTTVTVEDDGDVLKSDIWLEADKKYKEAVERLAQVKANRAAKVEEEDQSDDFSRESPQVAISAPAVLTANKADWEKRIKEYSAIFNKYPDIYESNVVFLSEAFNDFLTNTEGTSIQTGRTHTRIAIIARTRAEDGMDLTRFEAFDARTADHLPNDATIRATVETMAKDLMALKAAPVIEPYTGPAILSGRASGVFFHEIFGHRIEGHRQKSEDEGQTFTKKVNQPVLPDFLSVVDDPTLDRMANVDLNGYYLYDDEGVKATKVNIVQDGILKNFLMSRSPIRGFDKSNGHGRKSVGYSPVGRQGNLIVQTSKSVSDEQLRAMLIEECKKQGKPFGLIFKDISGGFTLTGREAPQSFQVTPIMVYRVYADGRPDELVRGVDLIGTPLTSFSKIIASGNTPEVFNGYCGAESGYVPVSAVSPSILTTQIEVQKKPKSSDRLPILPAPGPKDSE
jgi:predicted Zn-dependent protease